MPASTPLIFIAIMFTRTIDGSRNTRTLLVPAFTSAQAEELLRIEGHIPALRSDPARPDVEVYLTTDGHMQLMRDANCPRVHSYGAASLWPTVNREEHARWLEVSTRPSRQDGVSYPAHYRRVA